MRVVRKQTSVKTAKPNFMMYFSICMAMVGAMMFGLDQGNFGNVQTFESFKSHWCEGKYGTNVTCHGEEVKDNEVWANGFVMWGGTLITFGAAAGALTLAPIMANKAGRRPAVALGGAITFCGCLVASYLSFGNVYIFYVGRVITGFGVGVACMVLPLYNAECSTPTIRGTTGSLFQLNVALGCLVATLFTLRCKDWAMGMFLPGVAGGILMVVMPFLPESPRYVMERKGYEAGKIELKKIRRGKIDVEADEIWEEIQAEKDTPQMGYGDLCRERNLRKRLLIACGLVCCQQLTGVNAFLSYAGTIFEKAGVTDPIMFNTFFNGWMIMFCVIGLMLIDSAVGGRRCQLLVATSIMGPPLIIAATALELDPIRYKYVTMSMVCLYGGGFQLAWGMVPWIYPSEIFNMSEKETAVSIAVFIGYVFNSLIVVVTPPLMSWNTPGTFYVFAGLNIFCGLFVFFFVKETKGVPLEQVPALFTRGGHAPCDVSTDEEGEGELVDSEGSSDEGLRS